MGTNNNAIKVVYCHFSFRRPRGKNYGIFACALYKDSPGKILVAKKVKAYELWQDHQHVTAIQSYWYALDCLWEWQSRLLEKDVTHVILVTDNSNLAGWIENPKRNKKYTPWMEKAYTPFGPGKKELRTNQVLANPRDSEKSHKFCKEELVENRIPEVNREVTKTVHKLQVQGMIPITDLIEEDKPIGLDLMQPKTVIESSESSNTVDEDDEIIDF